MPAARVFRVDVTPRVPAEPAARRVYLIRTAAGEQAVRRLALPLLADGVADEAKLHAEPFDAPPGVGWVEVHPKPGVTDPAAASVEAALRRRGLADAAVRTGRAFAFANDPPRVELERAAASLSNGVVEHVGFAPHFPTDFPAAPDQPSAVRRVAVTTLDDAGLERLSRDGHLFLNLAEMRAIRDFFSDLGRQPTDAELETLAQTWSEHCVHKTLKSAVVVRDEDGRELRRYGNLIRDTIFASTRQLINRRGDGFCLSVFKDNAGVIAFDDIDGVCFKVETHNRPSAIEPYGGAATGIGGVIRDVLGTGLGARPVANTDVFCVAPSFETSNLKFEIPEGVIPPARVLDGIVSGVRDYGNRMGIPTVNGAIYYHADYVANPLVFCGCVGVIPREKVEKKVGAGDRIVLMGGRTGRDGIHGATFSSAELTDAAGSEFGHAVQIGNAITEKQVADVLLAARDAGLFTAVTDCGAGGLSSAVGEMGEAVGAFVQLDSVPLKYAGLRYDEVWISEAQERMVLSVPPGKLDDLLALCAAEDVEATDLGHFGERGDDGPQLILHWHGEPVGDLPMRFVHDGLPMPEREAVVAARGASFQLATSATFIDETPADASEDDGKLEACPTGQMLLRTLAHPNVASKHRVVRQYDAEVQAGTVVKPFVGPQQLGPADAAVIRPKFDSQRGVAVGCGLAPQIDDPYAMAIASIDEAIRNVICVGGDFGQLALLDNFCWPGTGDAETMGTLVLACEACRDAALAFGTPFVSGKDSLHNQFTDNRTGRTIRIPRTLLISVMAVVEDVAACVTSDLKRPGDGLFLLSPADESLAGRAKAHAAASRLIRGGTVTVAHDVSDGGWLTAVAEMCVGGNLGATLVHDAEPFAEPMTRYVIAAADEPRDDALQVVRLGEATADRTLRLASGESVPVADLRRAWRGE